MTSTKLNASNDISAQILGLTDKHIHYFEQPQIHTSSAKVSGIHQQMLDGYEALVSAAAKAGLTIKIASGFRSFERQLHIWNNKFTGKGVIKNINGDPVNIDELTELEIINAILLYSALPGASRHHWGCDIDIYDEILLAGQTLQLEAWEYSNTGPMAKLSTWLEGNIAKYDFYFPYDSFRGGIAAEPWHLSYAPLANQYQSTMDLALLKQCLLQTDIAGKNTIIENLSDIFTRYITNVNTNQLPIT